MHFGEGSLITAFMLRTVLRGAILTNCRAIGCQFDGADLRSTNLEGADLSGASFIEAIYNSDTVWPSGFDPVAAGSLLEADRPTPDSPPQTPRG
jgi:uncharacterized protein YjbI with pentapeptide repeats